MYGRQLRLFIRHRLEDGTCSGGIAEHTVRAYEQQQRLLLPGHRGQNLPRFRGRPSSVRVQRVCDARQGRRHRTV
jgi:hypothetical protein